MIYENVIQYTIVIFYFMFNKKKMAKEICKRDLVLFTKNYYFVTHSWDRINVEKRGIGKNEIKGKNVDS